MAAKCARLRRQSYPLPVGTHTPLDLWCNARRRGGDEPDARLYSYVVASIQLENNRFVQYGSAPNFQGGYVTLCTCKHEMRSYLTCRQWPGVWIAGLSGRNVDATNQHYLIYLMRIKWAFASHYDLWRCQELPLRMKEAKAAHLAPFGDLYWPADGQVDPYAPASYLRPIQGHSHEKADKWHKDIDHVGHRTRNRSALLVGDPEQTYIWPHPMIYTCEEFTQGEKKWELGEFLLQFDVRETADEDRTA